MKYLTLETYGLMLKEFSILLLAMLMFIGIAKQLKSVTQLNNNTISYADVKGDK